MPELKKIAVTGGTGFIGQALLRAYKGQYAFNVVTHEDTSALLKDDSIRYISTNYVPEDLRNAFAGSACVIHMGAMRPNGDSESAFMNYFGNVEFSEKVFRAAREAGVVNVVNISSMSVYDSTCMAPPFREDVEVSPINYYGAAKRTVEMCADICNKRYGMRIKSLRLAHVIGNGERGGYMLSIFRDRCLRGLPLQVYGSGNTAREYLYVRDAVRAIITAAETPDAVGIFNIGMGVPVTNRAVAEAFCRVFGNRAGYECLPDRSEDGTVEYLDVAKARYCLGFECFYDLESALLNMRAETEAEFGGED